MDGLPPAPRGIPKIEVTFDIDASGILDVTAKDTATGKSQSLRITGSTRLSEEEKRRMIEGAARYAEEDRRRRQQAEQLNAADAVCYQAERLLADFGAKLTNEQRQGLEAALRETREAVAERDAASATARAEPLKRLLQEAGAAMYAQTPRAGPQPRPETGAATGEARPTGPGPSGRVVEAEYRESRKN